jgi:hypothetical protein
MIEATETYATLRSTGQRGAYVAPAPLPPGRLGVSMKPCLRPSKPARSSLFSRFCFLFSCFALMRPSMFSRRLRQAEQCQQARSAGSQQPLGS